MNGGGSQEGYWAGGKPGRGLRWRETRKVTALGGDQEGGWAAVKLGRRLCCKTTRGLGDNLEGDCTNGQPGGGLVWGETRKKIGLWGKHERDWAMGKQKEN